MNAKIVVAVLMVTGYLGACSMTSASPGSGDHTPPSASDNKTH